MRLAIVAVGFTPGQADALRRAMAGWERKGNRTAEFAERCFGQIKGFSAYGFLEPHTASFELFVSAWLKRQYLAAFVAALINSQSLGFYAPTQLVRDAQDHGVTLLPIDAQRSAWGCTLEPTGGRARRRCGWGRGW